MVKALWKSEEPGGDEPGGRDVPVAFRHAVRPMAERHARRFLTALREGSGRGRTRRTRREELGEILAPLDYEDQETVGALYRDEYVAALARARPSIRPVPAGKRSFRVGLPRFAWKVGKKKPAEAAVKTDGGLPQAYKYGAMALGYVVVGALWFWLFWAS